MKVKVSERKVKESYNTIICIGYCEAYHLLWTSNPCYYTAGIYGWNSDIYEINGVAISTGYRPIGRITNESYNLVRRYDEQAKKVYDSRLKYETKKKKIENILNKFIEAYKTMKEV